jgi:hypothetical protein
MTVSEEDQILIDHLSTNKNEFNQFVYTPLEEAVSLLTKRRANLLESKLSIPSPLEKDSRAVLFRQVLTSNYEARRFLNLIESTELKPLFFEYYKDKFTSNNEFKHSLGRLLFYKGRGKKDGTQIYSQTIVDFNLSNGKPIEELKTLWGQPLIDFHHQLFHSSFKQLGDDDFFDASQWFSENGGSAMEYYESFISLFTQHAILFEDFMINEKELFFTTKVFLPVFLKILRETGLKPLIVSLEPTEIEDSRFWMCHPFSDFEIVRQKLCK